MSMKSKIMRVFAGKSGESWQKMDDYMNVASKRWLPLARKGSVLTEDNLVKFLTPKEAREYRKAKKIFHDYWKAEKVRKKAREMLYTTKILIPAKKLKKII